MKWEMVEEGRKLLSEETGAYNRQRDDRTGVVLVYPNTYYVGMSNLGFQSIYRIINQRDDAYCERAFLPSGDRTSTDSEVISIENGKKLSEFDVVAFSISFEDDYVNVLKILDSARIPLKSSERTDYDPVVIAGGISVSANPEPLSLYIDAFVIGEGEEVISEIMDLAVQKMDKKRVELIGLLSEINGVYVPAVFNVEYDGNGYPIPPAKNIRRRIVKDLERFDVSSTVITPNTEFGNMKLVEVTRGCSRGCRFCLSGFLCRPPRFRKPEYVTELAEKIIDKRIKLGLIGMTVSDHPKILEMCAGMEKARTKFSLSSMNVDSASEELIHCMAKGGQNTVTIAPETGSPCLAKIINKDFSYDRIENVMKLCFNHGIYRLKFYLMVGLPWETEGDIEDTIKLGKMVSGLVKEYTAKLKSRFTVIFNINPFVPKPHTPFQWLPMEDAKIIGKKLSHIKSAIAKYGGINIDSYNVTSAIVQAVISRGDRRVGEILEMMYKFNANLKNMFKTANREIEWYIYRRRGEEEVFPWDFIKGHVDKSFLRKELVLAEKGEFSKNCAFDNCGNCEDKCNQ